MIYLLDDNEPFFPSPRNADPETGLVAIGGDLSPERLLLAYTLGIFPWYNEQETPILWHSPDPRMVLFADQLIVNRSLRRSINKGRYEVRYNTAFSEVLRHCAAVKRPDQEGTWLNTTLIESLKRLHNWGYAHSAEAWEGDELVGGLYGVTVGSIFFGESMFAHRSDASKVVFAQLIPKLHELGYQMIDCQAHTNHLERFGAFEIERDVFLDLIRMWIAQPLDCVWPT